MKKVVVTRLGVYDSIRRRPGVVFEIPDTMAVPSWCELVKTEAQVEALKPKKKVREEPTTLSAMTRADERARVNEPIL